MCVVSLVSGSPKVSVCYSHNEYRQGNLAGIAARALTGSLLGFVVVFALIY
jgi:hypothetical protein